MSSESGTMYSAASDDESSQHGSHGVSHTELADIVAQMDHLNLDPEQQGRDEVLSSPLLTVPVINTSPPSQYGLFGISLSEESLATGVTRVDSRIFHNVACPSSVFICGSQGSGKSNTLACLLENCLLPSYLGRLTLPLTGIIFHYDSFVSDSGGLPCEAAFLASNKDVSVRVLCAPTNVRTIERIYSGISNLKIEPLRLSDRDLNTKRMNDLMAVGEGTMPLYMHVINRILREMRIEQQNLGVPFKYKTFKKRLSEADLTPAQRSPLSQRLDTLESFMLGGTGNVTKTSIDWTPKSGQLTVVDLSCPCVTPELACSLFNICLSLFLEQQSPVGKVVALDEAHKYMKESDESQTLTNSLLETIRLQRHLGVRVFISTQEPTVSTKLLDLCSMTIVHRFTSPDWLRTLRQHLAGVSSMSVTMAGEKESNYAVAPIAVGTKDPALELFGMIVSLHTGQAFVFAPSTVLGSRNERNVVVLQRLAHRALRIKVRSRLTKDGGKTVMA
ncbi:P-loop containing nucleoside triphosphate hydrolase [Colletotrichum asianum]